MGAGQGSEAAEVGAILNTLKYLDYDVKDTSDISKILANARTNVNNKGKEAVITKIENALQNNSALKNLEIGNQSVKMEGFDSKERGGLDACTFSDGKNVYVVYRGTGDAEWIDNGEGLSGAPEYLQGTQQQKQALEYFDKIAGNIPQESNLYMTGHSKGGNKAQYVTLESQYADRIDQCFSYDGQGMSPEYIAEYKRRYGEDAFEEAVNKMYAHCADNDYVSPLGVTIIPKDHRTYYETPGLPPLSIDNHQADAILGEDGRMNAETKPPHERGPIGQIVENISDRIMQEDNEGYPNREDLAIGAMGFADMGLGGQASMDGRTAKFLEYAAAAGYSIVNLIPKDMMPTAFSGGTIGVGNKFKIEFSELESAQKQANKASEHSADYARRIRNFAVPQITGISGGMSGNLNQASESLEEKAKKLEKKSEDLETYAKKLRNLGTFAKEADCAVKDKALGCFTDFADHNNIKVSKVAYQLLSWFHDIKDNTVLGRVSEFLSSYISSIKKDIKTYIKKLWNEGGGKFIASIGAGILGGVAAIASIVIAIGAFATAPIWGTIAAVVGGLIAVAGGITTAVYGWKAFKKNQEGDLGWATRQSKVKKASDYLRKDSDFENADTWADILDGTEFVCDVLNVVQTVSQLEAVGNTFATRQSADTRLFMGEKIVFDKKPQFKYNWDSIKDGFQSIGEINGSERRFKLWKDAVKIDVMKDIKTGINNKLKPITKFGHHMDDIKVKTNIGKTTIKVLEIGKSANDLYQFGKGGIDVFTRGETAKNSKYWSEFRYAAVSGDNFE